MWFRQFNTAVIVLLFMIVQACTDDPAAAPVAADTDDMRSAPDIGAQDRSTDDVSDETGDTPIQDDATADSVIDSETDTDGPTPDLQQDTDSPCVDPGSAYTGILITDLNQDPIDVNDTMLVSIEVFPGAMSGPSTLTIETENLDIDEGSIQRDEITFDGAVVMGGIIQITLDEIARTVFSFEGSVETDQALIVVLAHLSAPQSGCLISRSHSGAVLQVLGGVFKSPTCIDMATHRSLQVAPQIEVRDIDTYRERNGRREDLRSDDFIYCPENPTVVHVAEFCLEIVPGQRISLAGNYLVDDHVWEVDDFVLIEVFEDNELQYDGFSSQYHSPNETFWCSDLSMLMCLDGCTATLTVEAEDRQITPFAQAPAYGDDARQYEDEDVEINQLLPRNPVPAAVRITILDVGLFGALEPALYLISEAP